MGVIGRAVPVTGGIQIMNKHDCSVIKYLERIADELRMKSQVHGERAKSAPGDLHWTIGVVRDYALEESYIIASSMVRGLSRDLSPEFLKAPPHCTCVVEKE